MDNIRSTLGGAAAGAGPTQPWKGSSQDFICGSEYLSVCRANVILIFHYFILHLRKI